jgi:V-type H+-transporting ATPase subunit e
VERDCRARLGPQLYNMADSSGIWVGSLVFLGVYFVLALPISLYVRSHTKDPRQVKDNFNLGWGLTAVAVVCMWLLWLCCYMHQMYPLATPKLE